MAAPAPPPAASTPATSPAATELEGSKATDEPPADEGVKWDQLVEDTKGDEAIAAATPEAPKSQPVTLKPDVEDILRKAGQSARNSLLKGGSDDDIEAAE